MSEVLAELKKGGSSGGSELTLLYNDGGSYTFTKAYRKVYVWLSAADGGQICTANIQGGGTLTAIGDKHILFSQAGVWINNSIYLAENVEIGTVITTNKPAQTILGIFVIE